jgi:hypothetical protein
MQGRPQQKEKKDKRAGKSLPKVASDGSVASKGSSFASGATTKALNADSRVEEFIAQGLLPVPESLLRVSPLEPVGSVVEKLYKWRLRSCIVTFDNGINEFFDCTDLACFIMEFVVGAEFFREYAAVEGEDWDTTKDKLKRVAEAPVGDAIKGNRGAGMFKRFDAESSLMDLMKLFSSQKRVPVYRDGLLCRVVTPSDILEMCCCVSEDTLQCLESTLLTELMRTWPGILSEIEVSEDHSVIEVIQAMRESGVDVTPVFEGLGRIRPSDGVERRSSVSSMDSEDPYATERNLVGQFDTAALRVMLVHLDHHEGCFWWEEDSITKNILLEP